MMIEAEHDRCASEGYHGYCQWKLKLVGVIL
jgi:hypothetical protein